MSNNRRADEWWAWREASTLATPSSLCGGDPGAVCVDWSPRRQQGVQRAGAVDLSGGLGPGAIGATNGPTGVGGPSSGIFANRPAAAVGGRLYLPTDAAEINRDNGTSWDKWGPIYPMVRAPTVANWTWVNQGTATATDSSTGLYIADATGHAGNSLAVLKRGLPASKTVIAHLSIAVAPGGSPTAGVVWRQSGGANAGRLVGIGMYATNSVSLALSEKMTSPTVWGGANYFQYAAFNPMNCWVKLAVTANNRETYFSPDGQNWVLVHTIGNTDWLVADEVGIFLDAASAAAGMLVDSWVEI